MKWGRGEKGEDEIGELEITNTKTNTKREGKCEDGIEEVERGKLKVVNHGADWHTHCMASSCNMGVQRGEGGDWKVENSRPTSHIFVRLGWIHLILDLCLPSLSCSG